MKIISDEEVNPTTSQLQIVSKILQEREQHREQMCARVQFLTVEAVKLQSSVCAKLEAEIKQHRATIDQQRKKRQQLEAITLKSSGDARMASKMVQISKKGQAQLDLQVASDAVRNETEALSRSGERFRDSKWSSLAQALNEMIWSEMAYHAK